jgi:hypothetical protein
LAGTAWLDRHDLASHAGRQAGLGFAWQADKQAGLVLAYQRGRGLLGLDSQVGRSSFCLTWQAGGQCMSFLGKQAGFGLVSLRLAGRQV